jgi:hypothetical protein
LYAPHLGGLGSSPLHCGRAIARAVSCLLPTLAAWVRAQLRSCGICSGLSSTGQVFAEYFDFPCQFSFHRLLRPHPHRPASGRRTKWTQSHPTPQKIKELLYFRLYYRLLRGHSPLSAASSVQRACAKHSLITVCIAT